MASALPRDVLTRRCRCGMPAAVATCIPIQDMLAVYMWWCGRPMAVASPRRALTRRYRYGKRNDRPSHIVGQNGRPGERGGCAPATLTGTAILLPLSHKTV